MRPHCVNIQTKASEQFLFSCIAVYHAVRGALVPLESMDETKVLIIQMKAATARWAALASGFVCQAVQSGSDFDVCNWNPST